MPSLKDKTQNSFCPRKKEAQKWKVPLSFEAHSPVPVKGSSQWIWVSSPLISQGSAPNPADLLLQERACACLFLSVCYSAVWIQDICSVLVVCNRIKFVNVQKIKIKIVVLILYQKSDDSRGPRILLLATTRGSKGYKWILKTLS